MKPSKSAVGWMFYDFANSSFVTVMVTVVFSVFFSKATLRDVPRVVNTNGLWRYPSP